MQMQLQRSSAAAIARSLQVLGPVAHRPTTRLCSSQAAEGPAATGPAGRWRSLRVIPLDGSAASLEASLRTLRELRPQQVMLETCAQRQDLALRRTAVEAEAAAEATESGGGDGSASPATSPLSHVDAIATVHGGLRGADVAALCKWAETADAQVYPIDRPYQETQNLVARRLLLRPRELLAFVRHSAALLTGGTGQAGVPSLSLGMRDVLEEEREQHMAAETAKRGVQGADLAIVCTSDRAAGLERHLLGVGAGSSATAVRGKASQAARIWPFLLVLVYVVVPIYAIVLVSWRVSRLIAAYLQGSFTLSQAPAPVVQEQSAASPGVTPQQSAAPVVQEQSAEQSAASPVAQRQ